MDRNYGNYMLLQQQDCTEHTCEKNQFCDLYLRLKEWERENLPELCKKPLQRWRPGSRWGTRMDFEIACSLPGEALCLISWSDESVCFSHHSHHFKEICFSGTANPLGGPVAGDQAVAERSHDEPEIVCAWDWTRLRKGEPEIVWSTKLLDHCQRIRQKLLSQPSRSQQPYLQNPYPKTQHRYLTLFTINFIGVPIHETCTHRLSLVPCPTHLVRWVDK